MRRDPRAAAGRDGLADDPGQLRRRGCDVYAVTERPDLVGLSDEQMLALGADEDRAVVTLNIADFAALHADWQARGRTHGGLVYVPTATFAQDRAFAGALVGSMDAVARAGRLPGRDETTFLRRS